MSKGEPSAATRIGQETNRQEFETIIHILRPPASTGCNLVHIQRDTLHQVRQYKKDRV